MSRYIDADKLQQAYKEIHGGKRSLLIDTEPTADVRENVRGAWLKGEYYSNGYKEEWIFPYCSICHYEIDKMYNFCPNCGADMRGGDAK